MFAGWRLRGDGVGGNGDQPDQEEDFYWSCSKGCGVGGSAATESEADDAKRIHEAFCPGV